MKRIQIIFIGLSLLVMILPFAGMAFFPTKQTVENRRPAEFPSLISEEGALNTDFFNRFDAWFNDHFAFRNELATSDSFLLGNVFGTSSQESVIYGTDGWLYYASTLPDYLGTGCMTERELFNLKHNLEILREWTREQGVELLLTVPPNKNTLYGDHMPYYDSKIVNPHHTIEALPEICRGIGLPYADLLSMFRGEAETLYLMRDSHWNGKGALLAYRCMMEETKRIREQEALNPESSDSSPNTPGVRGYEWDYDDYSDAPVIRTRDADGDLNRMLYTIYGKKEMDTHYGIDHTYTYTTETKSVEDSWICTKKDGTNGKLLMFRDSFGNSLLPYIADQFGSACFSREAPYRLRKLVKEQKPDLIIIEKVERNLRDFITDPPILPAPIWASDLDAEAIIKKGTGIKVDPKKIGFHALDSPYDPTMRQIFGTVPEELLNEETEILLYVNGTIRKACHTGMNGFMIYMDREECPENPQVRVILKDEDTYRVLPEIEEEP